MEILDQFGRPYDLATSQTRKINESSEVKSLRARISRMLQGGYDAAQTSTDNKNHWAWADNLNPMKKNTRGVRQRLRRRSRYEILQNNPYLHGSMLTIARDFVGKGGPKLQITDKRLSPAQRKVISHKSNRYRKLAKYKRKLLQARIGKILDGDSFLVEFSNSRLRRQGMNLAVDAFVLEPDFIGEDLYGSTGFRDDIIDGIRYDDNMMPEAYYVIDRTPENYNRGFIRGSWMDADFVTHWYRPLQGSWLRGIPELTPSLPLCALLRRYSLAVVQNAELGANLTGVLETEMPPNSATWGDSTEPEDAFFTFPVERGMLMALPGGQKLHSFDPGQPLAVYDKFVDAVLREIIRPLCMPFNLAVGFSGGYNMASGTLDRQMYIGGIDHERADCEDEVLDPLDSAWYYEAIRTRGYFTDENGNDLTESIRAITGDEFPEHSNRWDEVPEHTDPQKVANAVKTLWESGFITDDDIQEKRYNRSAEEHYENLARQKERREALELPVPGSSQAAGMPAPQEAEEDDEPEESDETAEAQMTLF